MFGGLSSRLIMDVQSSGDEVNGGTLIGCADLLHKVSGPDIDDDVLRVRKLARNIK